MPPSHPPKILHAHLLVPTLPPHNHCRPRSQVEVDPRVVHMHHSSRNGHSILHRGTRLILRDLVEDALLSHHARPCKTEPPREGFGKSERTQRRRSRTSSESSCPRRPAGPVLDITSHVTDINGKGKTAPLFIFHKSSGNRRSKHSSSF